MFFFPYSTDAPIHHWPWATVGLIVVNFLIFIGAVIHNPFVLAGIPAGEPWVLVYGNGLHPDQWFASGFMHLGPIHLIFNMIFLWVFGLVVEGKIGSVKFLICYFSIMVGESAIEQLVMLNATPGGGSMGASAAIFGIMAMAALWAPSNNVYCKWGILMLINTVEIPLAGFVAFYIGLEILLAMILYPSSLLHLGGALIGAAFGLVMLKNKLVDCEGWDVFSVLKNNAPGADKRAKEERKQFTEKVDQRKHDREAKRLQEAAEQIHLFLNDGNHIAAHKLYEAMKPYGEGPQLATEDLLTMVRLKHKAKQYSDSVPFMQQLIERKPNATHPMRVKLAQICVVEIERPGYALELLEGVDANRLKPEQQQLAKKLSVKAKQMQNEGVVELDEPLV